MHLALELLGLPLPLRDDLTLFVDLFVGIDELERDWERYLTKFAQA